MNVRLMSFILEMILIYVIKIPIRIQPSRIAITVSEVMNMRNTLAIRSGSTMKIATAMNTETIITPVMTALSSFSPNRSVSHFSILPGSSSPSSSTIKPADHVSVRMPRIMESAKLKIPRTNGSEKNFTFSVILT